MHLQLDQDKINQVNIFCNKLARQILTYDGQQESMNLKHFSLEAFFITMNVVENYKQKSNTALVKLLYLRVLQIVTSLTTLAYIASHF